MLEPREILTGLLFKVFMPLMPALLVPAPHLDLRILAVRLNFKATVGRVHCLSSRVSSREVSLRIGFGIKSHCGLSSLTLLRVRVVVLVLPLHDLIRSPPAVLSPRVVLL